jgi:N-acetyl sugar amidotransferase
MVLETPLVAYKQCTRCILDTNDDPAIFFDGEGVCSYCHSYDQLQKKFLRTGEDGKKLIEETVQKIKREGRSKKYDCMIGLSGGVDSSYVAYTAKQFGLRALCVHFDNGWNSELAVMNIHNIVHKLDFDLDTYVIDWEEFKDLQLAYLQASVIDIEVLTDHAIGASMFKLAKEKGIKYFLGGQNIVTEGVLPHRWTFEKDDYINIKAIHKTYGKKQLKTFPFIDRKMKKFIKSSDVESINYLNWLPYNKDEVKALLQKELDWKDYGGKHYESIWTRFYQGYILPVKFGVDKRKAHLSSLICSGQISREAALEEMKTSPYDPKQLKIDKEFILKKLGLTADEFEAFMQLPIRSHKEFDTEGSLFNYYPVLKPFKPIWTAIKSLSHN